MTTTRFQALPEAVRTRLAERVRTARESGPAAIPRHAGDGPAPASFNQERLWLVDRLGRAGHVYNIYHALRIGGPLREPALRRALDGLVAGHPALRTSFAAGESGPVQIVAPPGPAALEVVDLRRVPPERRESTLDDLVLESCRRPFDLARGPLFRATLLRCADEVHVLVLAVHHIVSDAWSTEVLIRDLAEGYEAALAGRPRRPAEDRVRYVDFAAWQRARSTGPRWEEELAFWRDRLADMPDVLDLATDRPRPRIQSDRGAEFTVSLPEDLVAALRERGAAEGVTLYMIVVAAVRALLCKYTGQDRFILASTVSGRHHPGVEDLVGFFVNTLALGGDLSGDPTVRELLARERETVLAAFAHQEVPFERLVEELRPARDLSRNPLAQVLVQLNRGATEGWRLPGLTVEELPVDNDIAKFDLSFFFRDAGPRLPLTVEYRTALFEHETVERLAGHLTVLLRAFAASPRRRLSELDLRSDEERRAAAQAAAPPPARAPARLDDLVEEQARRTPDATAVVAGGVRLTYAELVRRMTRLARRMRRMGVRPGDRVAVRLDRGPDLQAVLLAVMKAGGAYVPLDPREAPERMAFILSDTEPRLLVTDAATPVGARVPVLTVGDAWDGDAGPAEHDTPWPAGSPDDLAYIVCTSGSTGRPKGVAVPHRAVVSCLDAMAERFGIGAGDAVLALSTPSFDMSVPELFLPLLVGGRTVHADEATALSPPALRRLIREQGVTVAQGTPDRWRLVAEGADLAGVTLLVGAESLTPAVAGELLDSGATVWHLYGPTEATIWSTAQRVGREHASCEAATVPIGGPLPGVVCRVVDEHLEPVPDGVPGELLLGGAQLPDGYWRRAPGAAPAFITGPSGQGRLYRTGDRVRRLGNGTLRFLGRRDHQVKIRGHRVETGEVEARLIAHPEVTAAVVTADETGGERRLVAHVARRDGGLTENALRRHVQAGLPGYMHPAAYVLLDRLPRTRTGKVDRAALPAPPRDGAAAGGDLADPAQRVIAGIWSEVLGVDPPGPDADFYALGGHSLAAIKIVTRVCAAFDVELGFYELFAAPTVAGQAAAVEEAVDAAIAGLSDAQVAELLSAGRPS
jgi:amino acid adenylation domain-containing protein